MAKERSNPKRERGKKGADGTPAGTDGPSDIFRVVSMIMQRGFDPVIIFAFSKRECMRLAQQIAQLDVTTQVRCSLMPMGVGCRV